MKKCALLVLLRLLLLLLLSVRCPRCDAFLWNDDEEKKEEEKNIIDLDAEIGSGEVLIDETTTSTGSPSTLLSSTPQSTLPPSTPQSSTTSASDVTKTPPTPTTRKEQGETTTVAQKKGWTTTPRVKNKPVPLTLSSKAWHQSARLTLKDPGSKEELGKVGVPSVNVRLRDRAAATYPGYSRPGLQYGQLHHDAHRLQSHMTSCPSCLRLQSPAVLCPVHEMGVEIDTWASQLKDALSYGCSMGPTDDERCCINGDSEVMEMLRDIKQRLRDVYHVLQTSCANCPKDGFWAEWTHWTHCTVSCGGGVRQRTRTCAKPSPSNGGRDCNGLANEEQHCYTADAPVNGGWSQWGSWSSCSASCGEGARMRIRTCNNPSRNACGQDCIGKDLEEEKCRSRPCCAYNSGQWNPWAPWTECSATCGVGNRERVRTCPNPTQDSECENRCLGSNREQTGCYAGNCCVDGGWGQWTPWTSCSVTCGSGGVKKRSRLCDSPQPNRCGSPCPGDNSESVSCNCEPCCVPDSWGSWAPWSLCSATCGRGERSRTRQCVQNPLNPCRQGCPGQGMERSPCDGGDCCVPSNWGLWAPWAPCSVTCGGGHRSRSRQCVKDDYNPCPRDCPGAGHEIQRCGFGECCVPNNWGAWAPWSSCSVTCGRGHRSRSRQCIKDAFNPCQQDCQGEGHQTHHCEARDCCVPNNWGAWAPWSSCSVTCGRGHRSRSRQCVKDAYNPCQQDCQGEGHQTRHCEVRDCCVPAVWSTWGSWGPCSATRGTGTSTRRRTCIVSSSNPCRRRCPGVNYETKECVPENPCSWSLWSLWSGCPSGCGAVQRVRTRSCLTRDKCPCAYPNTCPGLNVERAPCHQAPCSPPCITDCSGKGNGYYPSCSGCSYYIHCRYNQGSLRQCPGLQEWDAYKEMCVNPPSESCSLATPVTSCRDRDDGLYHVINSCERYLECRGGTGTERTCPHGQELNAHSQRCEPSPSRTCKRSLNHLGPMRQTLLPQDSPSNDASNATDEKKTKKDTKKMEINILERILLNSSSVEDKENNPHEKKKAKNEDKTSKKAYSSADTRKRENLILKNETNSDQPDRKNRTHSTHDPRHNTSSQSDNSEIPQSKLGGAPQNGPSLETKPSSKSERKKSLDDDEEEHHSEEAKAFVISNRDSSQRKTLDASSGEDAAFTSMADEELVQKYTTDGTPVQKPAADGDSEQKLTTDEDLEQKYTTDGTPVQNPAADGDLEQKSTSDGSLEHGSASGGSKAGLKLRHRGKKLQEHPSRKAAPCHADCEGLRRGRKYQSCQGCRFYLVCPHHGPAHIKRCPGRRKWDHALQRCRRHSSTCRHSMKNEVKEIGAGSSLSGGEKAAGSSFPSKPAILGIRMRET